MYFYNIYAENYDKTKTNTNIIVFLYKKTGSIFIIFSKIIHL